MIVPLLTDMWPSCCEPCVCVTRPHVTELLWLGPGKSLTSGISDKSSSPVHTVNLNRTSQFKANHSSAESLPSSPWHQLHRWWSRVPRAGLSSQPTELSSLAGSPDIFPYPSPDQDIFLFYWCDHCETFHLTGNWSRSYYLCAEVFGRFGFRPI